jgi:hypothetical protein
LVNGLSDDLFGVSGHQPAGVIGMRQSNRAATLSVTGTDQPGDSFSAFFSACACPVGCAVSRGSISPLSLSLLTFRFDSAASVSGVGRLELPGGAVFMSAPRHKQRRLRDVLTLVLAVRDHTLWD